MNQWFLFKEVIYVFNVVLNFIFDLFQSFGIVNVGVSIIFFSLFSQVVMLPFSINDGIKATKSKEKEEKLKKLSEEYEDNLSDPVLLTEYKEKQKEIKENGSSKKGKGCLVLLIQLFVIMCLLATIGTMNQGVDVMSNLDSDSLSNAYSLMGIDLANSVKQQWWPSIVLVVVYVLASWLPGTIKQHFAEKKEKEKYLAESTDIDKEVMADVGNKKDAFSIFMACIKLLGPVMIFLICLGVPCFYVIYWTANLFWKKVLFQVSKFMYRKVWPKIKQLSAA